MTGHEYQSNVIRSNKDSMKLEQLGFWTVIIELQRHLFFGSVSQLYDEVASMIKDQSFEHRVTRTRYLIIDWHSVDGIDFTGVSRILEIIKLCKSAKMKVVFTGMTGKNFSVLECE